MYNKVFLAQLSALHHMLDFIKNYALNHQVASLPLDQLILASEEVLVNIIHYGYPKEKKGTIDITCEERGQPLGIKVIFKDHGIAFNPLVEAPSLPLSLNLSDKSTHSLGGYGIYIFIKLMDDVDYQRSDNRNILSLTKYL